MASEKQIKLETEYVIENSQSSSQSRRRKVMIALGGVAVLATGMAIGLSTSMLCGNTIRSDLRVSTTPVMSITPDHIFHSLSRRGVVRSNTSKTTKTANKDPEVVGQGRFPLAATRPKKYYGPTLSPDQAKTYKASHAMASIEKKDIPDEAESIEARGLNVLRATSHRVWQPTPGLTWTYQLNQPPNSTQLKNPGQYQVWDIDLFDTPQSSIQTIQSAGSKVICYFSAGTWENWRPDASKFTAADIGTSVGNWPGEDWINTNSANVRSIMSARLDLAKQKGCDAVDPDNIDSYNHNTGFSLTQSNAINYVNYLAQQAASRGLAISLKNSGDIISSVINAVQFSVEEACYTYNECNIYAPFTLNNKAVFHVEYPKGYGVVNNNLVSPATMAAICSCRRNWRLSPIVKNNDLGTWQQACP